jgi:hypothetical protein
MTLAGRTEPDVERRLRQAVLAGEPLDLRGRDGKVDDPSSGNEWDASRTVRASLLIDLLTAGDSIHRRGLWLFGARISGTLDLEAAELTCPVHLHECFFDEPVNLTEVSMRSLSLSGSHVPALYAEQWSLAGWILITAIVAALSGLIKRD